MIKIDTTRNTNDPPKAKIVHRTVTLHEPIDGSGFKPHTVKVSYRLMTKSEAESLMGNDDKAFLQSVVVGWGDPNNGKGGFADLDGNALEHTSENQDAVYDVAWIATGLIKDYFATVAGGKRGN